MYGRQKPPSLELMSRAKKKDRVFRALIRIDRDLVECEITQRISCPYCFSSKIFVNKKWEWSDRFKEAYLISDWTCKTCGSDFEGDDLTYDK